MAKAASKITARSEPVFRDPTEPDSTRPVSKPITGEEKGYARAAVRLKIARAVWALWQRVREEDGVDQTWLVARLGSNKGRVSRLLNGSGNWTLDTVADLLEAMEGRLTLVEVKRYCEVDAEMRAQPSLLGLRDNPGLWSVINIDSGEGEELLYDAQVMPMLGASTSRFRVISDEPV